MSDETVMLGVMAVAGAFAFNAYSTLFGRSAVAKLYTRYHRAHGVACGPLHFQALGGGV